MVFIHTDTNTTEYSSAIKRKEILSFAAMWLDLMLSEISQTERQILYVESKEEIQTHRKMMSDFWLLETGLRYADDTTLMAESEEELESLEESERGE